MAKPKKYLGIDFGIKRVGLATGDSQVRLAMPFLTLGSDGSFWQRLEDIIRSEEIDELVLGLPHGLSGQETAMTRAVNDFAQALKGLGLKVHLQDEAVTSEAAKSILRQSSQHPAKADVDSQAAAIILQDFLDGL